MRQYGIFLGDLDDHIKLWLSHRIKDKYVKLNSCPYQYIGAGVEVDIVGFGFDCEIAAFKVRIAEEIEHLADYPRCVVTSTHAPNSTRNPQTLEFTQYEKPIRIMGVLGYEENGKLILDGYGTGKMFQLFASSSNS